MPLSYLLGFLPFYQTYITFDNDEFHPKYSKAIIDDIDLILAWHHGFTDYDIKYRMGKQHGTDDDDS